VFNIKHLHPKILKYEILEARSWNNSNGVLFKIGLNKTLFRTKQAHETASAQSDLGRLDSHKSVLAHSCSVLFFLSTTPFCCGVR
jgi:hypothetical protein